MTRVIVGAFAPFLALTASASIVQFSPSTGDNTRVTATDSTQTRTLKDSLRDLYGHAPGAPLSRADGRAAFVSLLRDLNTAGGKRVTWVGDSLTEQGKTAGQGFTYQIEQTYPNITYSNQGTGGNTTTDVIARLATITATNADLYVLAIGVNDARYNDSRGATTAAAYVANMTTIVNALKAGGKSVVVLSIWPTYWKDAFSALGRKATDDRFVQWNHALEYACVNTLSVPFVDVYSALVKAVDFQNMPTLVPDGVHPDWNGAAFIGTAGAKLYASAILRGPVEKGEFAPEFIPTGSVFYKLVVPDNGAASDWISVQNINPGTPSDWFAYSGNSAVNATGLIGPYNASAAGFLNKAGDWPAVLTWGTPTWVTSVITAPRAAGLGITAWELYLSTDPRSVADPSHPSWVLHTREPSTRAFAHNLMPSKREAVFYRLQVDSSDGVDGTGGTTGIYVKITKVWGGSPPVRWTSVNTYAAASIRSDLVFSAAGGGDGTLNIYNPANTYPVHIMWESESELSSLALGSVQGTGRAIKQWELFESHDPESLGSTTHASWRQVSAGVGDQTASLKTCRQITGAGSPEGAVTGSVCWTYVRTDGGAGTTLYVKESGAGTNTGWVGK